MSCRRCSDCEGMDHHRLPEVDFLGNPSEVCYSCLHCAIMAVLCPECEGLGTVDDPFDDGEEDDDYSLDPECPACNGWGIVEKAGANKPP